MKLEPYKLSDAEKHSLLRIRGGYVMNLSESREATPGVVVTEAPAMDVRLVAYPEELERLLCFAGRSTWKGHTGVTWEMLPDDEDYGGMLDRMVKCGHGSVLEHGMFTFDVRNVSRALTHQLVRHRMASYTQESQHYIDYKRMMFVMPDNLSDVQKVMFYQTCKESFELYRNLVDSGYPAFEARAILPSAVASRIVASFNARSLDNLFGLRCCHINTWEIRRLAWKMLAICKAVCPTLFKYMGPRCWSLGWCPEGKRRCDKYPLIPDGHFGQGHPGDRRWGP